MELMDGGILPLLQLPLLLLQKASSSVSLVLPGALLVWLGPLLVLLVLCLHGHQDQSPHSQEGV